VASETLTGSRVMVGTMAEAAVTISNIVQITLVIQPPSTAVNAGTTTENVIATSPPTIQATVVVVRTVVVIKAAAKTSSSSVVAITGMIVIARNPANGQDHPQEGIRRSAVVAGPATEVPMVASLPLGQPPSRTARTITVKMIIVTMTTVDRIAPSRDQNVPKKSPKPMVI